MRAAAPAFKKVEIVYYLSRNGHLEHPHYMEVTYLSHQQLRLKDVMDRLTVLRGKGMPSLYSWSCKRSYKNGYVWNDLSVNDVIHPSQGTEFVLKGSELIHADKLHHDLQLGNVVQPKRKSLPSNRQQHEPEEMSKNNHNNNNHCDNYHIEEEEEEEEFKEQVEPHKNGASDLLLSSFSSPPSTTSSTVSDKANNDIIITNINTNTNNNISASKRYEDGDQVGNEPALSINSMLLSLIACGGSASFRKTVPPPVVKPPLPPCTIGSGGGGRVVVKVAVEEDEIMMGRISENPRRFGKLQAEEKEYFSGSIVEAMSMERIEVQPGLLKKSSSHSEERSNVIGLREAADEVEREKGLKGKCIPRKKSSAKH
ncbi:hypothetical protein MIMGU_mgv1a008596mg [Erythranthe guttata]|uniref:SOSEKI DIX-like domain-containing protein n=2 Tax=Erythranthe guttata TaxID=4155 RepID=A0A022QTX7_ERYGU|nr:hypothetical protein MIMGU_mgv1a008596mg [Erythranthe guttata]